MGGEVEAEREREGRVTWEEREGTGWWSRSQGDGMWAVTCHQQNPYPCH